MSKWSACLCVIITTSATGNDSSVGLSGSRLYLPGSIKSVFPFFDVSNIVLCASRFSFIAFCLFITYSGFLVKPSDSLRELAEFSFHSPFQARCCSTDLICPESQIVTSSPFLPSPAMWQNGIPPSPLQTHSHGCSHATHGTGPREHPAPLSAAISSVFLVHRSHWREA